MDMYEKNHPDSDDDEFCPCPNCAICTVELIDGEDIVMVHHPTEQVTKIPYDSCRLECPHRNGRAAACHVWCHQAMGTPSQQLCVAICPDFDPRPVKAIATQSFFDTLSEMTCVRYKLPMDISRAITPHLVQPWCAAYSALLQPSELSKTVVDLSIRVWASFTKFYGRVYLSGLSNTPSKGPCECLVYDPTSSAAEGIDALYVAYDAWGVTRMVYARSNVYQDFEEESGRWWRTISLRHNASILVKSDGLKIRSVTLQGGIHEDRASKAMWAVPRPSITPLSFYNSGDWYELARYESCLLNGRDITGYSYHATIEKLVAHRAEDTSHYPASFSRPGKLSMLLYMPMDIGEWITDVWLRKEPDPFYKGLILRTNKSRVQAMGYYRRHPGGKSSIYAKIAVLHGEPCRLFFDTCNGIARLGIESNRPIQEEPPLPTPLSPWPAPSSRKAYSYSATLLDDICEVRICRTRDVITGMVLEDTWGHRTCLGNINLDALLPPAGVNKSPGFWITMARRSYAYLRHVTDIQFDTPEDNGRYYVRLPWKGLLEWWFSARECWIYHNGEELVPPLLRSEQ